MKALLRAIAPRGLRRAVARVRRGLEARRNARQSVEQVFSEIYREGKWGRRDQANAGFHSGSGSANESIVGPYVEAIARELGSLPAPPRVVDLGCGDFTVGRRLVGYCARYVAVDVVPDLVRHLRATVKDRRVEFVCLDITSAAQLPEGDVCMIRQVLQHLSNAEIAAVIPKLGQYRRVYITEHYPAESKAIVPNRDQVHGAHARLYDNSAVYLDQPPFNLPRENLSLVLETRAPDFGDLYDGGFIRTYRLIP
jgi:SAM-dependent methyltransferase